MKTLTLPLKRKWFDMIKAGVKKEEYREIKPHYIRQFIKFEPLKNDLIRDYNFYKGFDEGEINGLENELLNLKYDVLEFSLAYPSRVEKDKWLTFKNPKIRIGTGRPEWGAEPGKRQVINYRDVACPNCGTIYGVGYSDVPHSVEIIHRICDTCMKPIEVKNPWNDKETKQ